MCDSFRDSPRKRAEHWECSRGWTQAVVRLPTLFLYHKPSEQVTIATVPPQSEPAEQWAEWGPGSPIWQGPQPLSTLFSAGSRELRVRVCEYWIPLFHQHHPPGALSSNPALTFWLCARTLSLSDRARACPLAPELGAGVLPVCLRV